MKIKITVLLLLLLSLSIAALSQVPEPAENVYPANSTQEIRITYISSAMMNPFIWSEAEGSPSGYYLSVGTGASQFDILEGQQVSDTTFQLGTELEYGATYFWQVVPYNGDGQAQDCPVWQFTIMEDPTMVITAEYPLMEGFETTQTGDWPLGWEIENFNEEHAFWSVIANSQTSQNAHTGEHAVHTPPNFSDDLDDWLYTQPLQLTGGVEYELKFWYRTLVLLNSFEKLEIMLGNMPTAGSMETRIFNNDNITNETYVEESVLFTPESDGIYFLGFHAYSGYFENFILLVDDISISTEYEEGIFNTSKISRKDQLSLTASPNPFNPSTTITFALDEPSYCNIEVYNLKGQLIRQLGSGYFDSGITYINWDGTDKMGQAVSSGVYFTRIESENFGTRTIKMLLIK